jgi:hypothetical protein
MTDSPEEQMITIPLSEYMNLFNLAALMQNKDSILATAQQRIQQSQQIAGPKLVKDKPGA